MNSSTATTSFVMPGLVNPGDFAVAVARTRGPTVTAPTSSDSTTWTEAANVVVGGLRVYFFWKLMTLADQTDGFTFTRSTSVRPRWRMNCHYFSDIQSALGVYDLASSSDTSARAYPTSLVAPSVLSIPDCLLVSSFTYRNGVSFTSGSMTAPTGMTTMLSDGNNNENEADSILWHDWYQLLSASGTTGTRTATNVTGGGGTASFVEGAMVSLLLIGADVTFGRGLIIGSLALD